MQQPVFFLLFPNGVFVSNAFNLHYSDENGTFLFCMFLHTLRSLMYIFAYLVISMMVFIIFKLVIIKPIKIYT